MQILTIMQRAQLLVLSYPYIPRVSNLLDAAAYDTEEPNAAKILATAKTKHAEAEWTIFLDYLKLISGDDSDHSAYIPIPRDHVIYAGHQVHGK